jgi:hypothetical protein
MFDEIPNKDGFTLLFFATTSPVLPFFFYLTPFTPNPLFPLSIMERGTGGEVYIIN